MIYLELAKTDLYIIVYTNQKYKRINNIFTRFFNSHIYKTQFMKLNIRIPYTKIINMIKSAFFLTMIHEY